MRWPNSVQFIKLSSLVSLSKGILSLILTTNQKRKYLEKYLAFSQASWAVSAIFFVKEMENKGEKAKIFLYDSRKDRPLRIT